MTPRADLTGRLERAQLPGAEKVRRLKEVFGDDFRLEAAYGDTEGDKAMLAIAEEPGLGTCRARLRLACAIRDEPRLETRPRPGPRPDSSPCSSACAPSPA